MIIDRDVAVRISADQCPVTSEADQFRVTAGGINLQQAASAWFDLRRRHYSECIGARVSHRKAVVRIVFSKNYQYRLHWNGFDVSLNDIQMSERLLVLSDRVRTRSCKSSFTSMLRLL